MYNKNARDELSSETVMIIYAYHTVQMSINDLRNYKNQYNEKNIVAPDVQQLPGGGPDAIFSLCLSIVFCLDYPMLPYAFSFYWHFVLRPLHFIFFLGGVPPPRHHTGIIYGIYIYIY